MSSRAWVAAGEACGSSSVPRPRQPVSSGARTQDANRFRSATRCRRRRRGPGGDDQLLPGRVHQIEPRAGTIAFIGVRALIFFSTATSSASCSAASRRRVFPARSRGRTEARSPWPAPGDVPLGLSRVSSASSRCSRLTVWWTRRVGRPAAATPRARRRRTAPAANATTRPSEGVALAVVAGVGTLGWHVDHLLAVGQQPLRQRATGAVAALDRPGPLRPSGHVTAHRGVARFVRTDQHLLVESTTSIVTRLG